MRWMPRVGRWEFVIVMLALSGGMALVLQADDKKPAEKSLAEELPRIPGYAYDKTMPTFKLAKGFTLELVAHEPDVLDPVDACFDENGRMYVAEMRDYPYSPEKRPQCPEGLGKTDAATVRLLEDTDADGKYAWSTNLPNDGVEPGQYIVTFKYVPKSKKNEQLGEDLFKGKYANPTKSEYKLTVEADQPQTDVNYELTMPGAKK